MELLFEIYTMERCNREREITLFLFGLRFLHGTQGPLLYNSGNLYAFLVLLICLLCHFYVILFSGWWHVKWLDFPCDP